MSLANVRGTSKETRLRKTRIGKDGAEIRKAENLQSINVFEKDK